MWSNKFESQEHSRMLEMDGSRGSGEHGQRQSNRRSHWQLGSGHIPHHLWVHHFLSQSTVLLHWSVESTHLLVWFILMFTKKMHVCFNILPFWGAIRIIRGRRMIWIHLFPGWTVLFPLFERPSLLHFRYVDATIVSINSMQNRLEAVSFKVLILYYQMAQTCIPSSDSFNSKVDP